MFRLRTTPKFGPLIKYKKLAEMQEVEGRGVGLNYKKWSWVEMGEIKPRSTCFLKNDIPTGRDAFLFLGRQTPRLCTFRRPLALGG